jgi:hypothetical protein
VGRGADDLAPLVKTVGQVVVRIGISRVRRHRASAALHGPDGAAATAGPRQRTDRGRAGI